LGGHVHYRPDKLDRARLLSKGASHDVKMLYGAIRHEQPMFMVKTSPLMHGAIQRALYGSPVLGMNSFED
jgi:hypothetical protein